MYSRLIGYIKRNVKCFFYIVNEIFLICGLFLIAFGSMVLQHTGNVLTFAIDFESKIYLIPITIIAAGCMIILISVSGCLGAKYNNVATLNFYAFLMYVMFIGHWILMQYMVYERDIFVNLAADFVDEAWGSKDDSMDTIDALQVEFNCCGVTGYEDYKELNRSTPFTCCRLNVFICAMEVLSDVAGCREAFTDYWAANTDIILFSGISIAYVQFACILIGSLMVTELRRKSYT